MIHDALFAIWFLLPAAAANAAPIISNALPYFKQWQAPVDGGRKYHGTRLLGSHKTWRGIVTGIIVSTIVFALQKAAVEHTAWGAYLAGGVDYGQLPTLVLGPLFGLGALGGDAVESFFKRRHHIKSGNSWFPFDQLDYVIGAILVSLPFVVVSFQRYIWMIVLWFLFHLAATYIGWRLKLKDKPI